MKPAQLAAYALVAVFSVSGAFLISLHFVKHAKAQAQEAPPDPAAVTAAAMAEAAKNTAVPPPQPTTPPPGNPEDGGGAAAGTANPPPNGQPSAGMPNLPKSGTVPPPAGMVPEPNRGAHPGGQGAGAAMPSVPKPQPAQPSIPPPEPDSSESSAANPPTTPKTPVPSPLPNPISGINDLEGFLEPFIYDLVNRRDPFQAYAEYVPAPAGSEGPTRVLSPAQRWDLDQLKLIGIMWDIKDPKAMFLDPEDDVMILGRDESIGNKNGYVATIREGEVVVVEAIRKKGDIIYRTRVLRIER